MTTTAPPPVAPCDPAHTDAFLGRVLEHASGTGTTVLAAIGDRLGPFADLAAGGPATPDGVSARTGIDSRHARGWPGAKASAGSLDDAPAGDLFTPPPEHVPVLAEERRLSFGTHRTPTGMIRPLDRLVTQ